jgi:RNA polymerase sigma-70 factor (ECF subfamily)
LPAEHPEFESLMDEVAQETLLRVLDRLDTFEGRSQFTTWVHKIAIRLAFSELRRRRWKDVSLDASMEDQDTPSMPEPVDQQANPEIQVERSDLMTRLNQLLQEELTDKQRMALQAVLCRVCLGRSRPNGHATQRSIQTSARCTKRLKQRMEEWG